MPSGIGPYFFELSAAPINSPPKQWTNPGDASGSPDGNYASVPCQVLSSSYFLWFTQWIGSQYIPSPISNLTVSIDVYGYKDPLASAVGTTWNSSFVYNNNFIPGATNGTVALSTTPSWQNLVRVSGSSLAYSGNIDSTFGIALNFAYDSGGFGSAPLYIDSVRMTASYNDGYYDVGYGFVRNKRRFVSNRNSQKKVVLQTNYPRMNKRSKKSKREAA